MVDQEVEDNQIAVRHWMHRHYTQGVKFINLAVCSHCHKRISYRDKYSNLHRY